MSATIKGLIARNGGPAQVYRQMLAEHGNAAPSQRTIARWAAGETTPEVWQIVALADQCYASGIDALEAVAAEQLAAIREASNGRA
jgi:hypothetical protein